VYRTKSQLGYPGVGIAGDVDPAGADGPPQELVQLGVDADQLGTVVGFAGRQEDGHEDRHSGWVCVVEQARVHCSHFPNTIHMSPVTAMPA